MPRIVTESQLKVLLKEKQPMHIHMAKKWYDVNQH